MNIAEHKLRKIIRSIIKEKYEDDHRASAYYNRKRLSDKLSNAPGSAWGDTEDSMRLAWKEREGNPPTQYALDKFQDDHKENLNLDSLINSEDSKLIYYLADHVNDSAKSSFTLDELIPDRLTTKEKEVLRNVLNHVFQLDVYGDTVSKKELYELFEKFNLDTSY